MDEARVGQQGTLTRVWTVAAGDPRRYRVAGQAGEGAPGKEVNGFWVRMTAWA
jgi:hypothetical protein